MAVIVSGGTLLVPLRLACRYSLMLSMASLPMKVLASSLVFCVMICMLMYWVFGFFSSALRKNPQSSSLASLILSPESLRKSIAALSVVWFRELLLRTLSMASLVARLTPLLSPLG